MVNIQLMAEEIRKSNRKVMDAVLDIIEVYMMEVWLDKKCSKAQAEKLAKSLNEMNNYNKEICNYYNYEGESLREEAEKIVEDCGTICSNLDTVWPIEREYLKTIM